MTKLVFYFLLRSKVKYELIILIFLGFFLAYDSDPSQYGAIYSSILLSILYTIYFHTLSQHKNRTTLLYKKNTIKRLKLDTIQSISLLSLSLFLVATIIDLFLLNTMYLIFYYIGILTIFIFSTLLVTINIEKSIRKTNTIITFKEGLKIIGIGIIFTVLITIFFQFI